MPLSSGGRTYTDQLTRLLLDEATDNIPLLLELIAGSGVNERIKGYLFGIAVFYPTRPVADRALQLLRQYAGTDTLRQAEKLREGAAYHYNDAEYLGKYRNPEFDIFDFVLAHKMCLWHRHKGERSPMAMAAHSTLDLTHYPESHLPETLATLSFVRYLTLPAHRDFQIEPSIPVLHQMNIEGLYAENVRMEVFPFSLLQLPRLRILSLKKGTHRPKGPLFVPEAAREQGSTTLQQLEMDGYPLSGHEWAGALPALRSVSLTRCTLPNLSFLAQSPLLEAVTLRQNGLQELPGFFSRLSHLRSLHISDNPLRSIHIQLEDMPFLEALEITPFATKTHKSKP